MDNGSVAPLSTVGIKAQTGIAPVCKTGTLPLTCTLYNLFGICVVTHSITQELVEEVCRIYSETNQMINIYTETSKEKSHTQG